MVQKEVAHSRVIFSAEPEPKKGLQECTCIYLSLPLTLFVWPGAALKIRSKYANLSLQLQPTSPPPRAPPNAAKCISYKVILHMAAGPEGTHQGRIIWSWLKM